MFVPEPGWPQNETIKNLESLKTQAIKSFTV